MCCLPIATVTGGLRMFISTRRKPLTRGKNWYVHLLAPKSIALKSAVTNNNQRGNNMKVLEAIPVKTYKDFLNDPYFEMMVINCHSQLVG